MTTTDTSNPADGAVPPELPPLSIGALMIGAMNLLHKAADLPQPVYVTVHENQRIGVLFAMEPASVRAIAGWAHRFGGVIVSKPEHEGPDTYCKTSFSYYGIEVDAYTWIPAKAAST